MARDGTREGRDSSRYARRLIPAVLLALGAAAAACSSSSVPSSSGAPPPDPEPAILVLAMPAAPESTLALMKLALEEAGGTAPTVQWSSTTAILSTRYSKYRRGPGTSVIAIIAAVSRHAMDAPSAPGPFTPVAPSTRVQLQAWAMDSVPERAIVERRRSNTEARFRHPRPVSPSDTADWAPLQRVFEALRDTYGGRVLH